MRSRKDRASVRRRARAPQGSGFAGVGADHAACLQGPDLVRRKLQPRREHIVRVLAERRCGERGLAVPFAGAYRRRGDTHCMAVLIEGADGLVVPDLLGMDGLVKDRKSTRLNSSHANISYAVFCLKKK